MYGLLVLISSCALKVTANRGDKLRMMFPPSPDTHVREDHQPIIRRPRSKWRLNEPDIIIKKPTTTKPPPATKSPQQIKAELEAEIRRRNPKRFLMGKNGDQIKIKLFGTVPVPTKSIEVKIKLMEDKLKNMQTRCYTNDDCTNRTCCFIDEKGIGSCKLRPHQIGQQCTDMCACVNDMECKLEEIDQEKKGVITTINKCARKIDKDSKEFEVELLAKLRTAAKKSKGCSALNCS